MKAFRYLVVFSLLATAPAEQVLAKGVNVQLWRPSSSGDFAVTEGAFDSKKSFGLSLDYNYVDDPLVTVNPDRTKRYGEITNSIQTLDLTAGAKVRNDFSLHTQIPLHQVEMADGTSENSLGDISILGKYSLGDAPFSDMSKYSLVPQVILSTGDKDLYLSDDGTAFGLKLVVEKDYSAFKIAFNAGYLYSPEAEAGSLDYRNRIPLAIGSNIPLSKSWSANIEASGALLVPFNSRTNPGELYAGLNHDLTRELLVSGGASIGSYSEATSTDYRFVVGLQWSPSSKRKTNSPKIEFGDRDLSGADLWEEEEVTFRKIKVKKNYLTGLRDIPFEHNSAILTAKGKKILNGVVRYLASNKSTYSKIVVEGHANHLGFSSMNESLSKRRANRVAVYLLEKGLSKHAVRFTFFGEKKPKRRLAASTLSEKHLAKDRRVEFRLVP